MEWYARHNQYQAKYFHPFKKVELNKLANKMSSIFKHVWYELSNWSMHWESCLLKGIRVATLQLKTQWQKFIFFSKLTFFAVARIRSTRNSDLFKMKIFYPNSTCRDNAWWQETSSKSSQKWKYLFSLETGVPGIVINLTEWTLFESEPGKVDNHHSAAFKKSTSGIMLTLFERLEFTTAFKSVLCIVYIFWFQTHLTDLYKCIPFYLFTEKHKHVYWTTKIFF